MKKRYLLFILMLVLVPSVVLASNKMTCRYEATGKLYDFQVVYTVTRESGGVIVDRTGFGGNVYSMAPISFIWDLIGGGLIRTGSPKVTSDIVTKEFFLKDGKLYCPNSIPYNKFGISTNALELLPTTYINLGKGKHNAALVLQEGAEIVTEIGDVNPINPNLNYDNFCANEGVSDVFKMIGHIIQILKWVVPIILIVMGIFDFAKASLSSDDKALSKATNSLVNRLVAGVIVFLAPSIIMALLKTFQFNGIITDERFVGCSEILFDVSNYDN